MDDASSKKRGTVLASAIIFFFLFFGLLSFIGGSSEFQDRSFAGISWAQQTGSGFSVPACGSSSTSGPTCDGGASVITIAWKWEGLIHADICVSAHVTISGGPSAVNQECDGSYTFTGLLPNTTYDYQVQYSGWLTGVIGTISGSFSTPNCGSPSPPPPTPPPPGPSTPPPSPSGSPPVAEAGLSKDGSVYSTSISVTRGEPVGIWLSASRDVTGDGIASHDPDGWDNPTLGVSNGGKCEWNIDFVKPGFAVQRTVSNPTSPASCNVGPLTKVFNDPPGTYLYELFRITDASGLQSAIATVLVTVASPVSVSLTANPPLINPGGTSILTWDTTGFGPQDCTIDQGVGDVHQDGTTPVSPVTTTTYTLSCSNGIDSAQTRATVYVTTSPIIKEVPPK